MVVMHKLNDNEMMNINGGSVSAGTIFLIAAGVTLVAGIIDGIIRPLRCN